MEEVTHKAGWNLDFDHIEPVQIAKYEPGAHYTWHTDTSLFDRSLDTQRKVSVVVMLSDPANYVGGGLEFCPESPKPVPNLQGSVYVFPSLVEHRVVPVTEGVRYSLAGWCRGPAFK
jgi:PKHD-type hydroxylase